MKDSGVAALGRHPPLASLCSIEQAWMLTFPAGEERKPKGGV